MRDYILFLIAGIFFTNALFAQITWTGATDTDWATGSNWDSGSVPMASDHVIIPNLVNQPIIDGTTSAACISMIIDPGASLDIDVGGSLSIDGTSTFVPNIALENLGTLINDGTINIGLNALVNLSAGFKNSSNATFVNNGSFFTDMVGITGGHVVTNYGDFQNNGFIEIGAGALYFGIFNSDPGSDFDNFGQIDSYCTVAANIFPSGNSLMENFGLINIYGAIRGLRLSAGSIFHNHECAEYYSDANVNSTGYINNEGLWYQSVNTVNDGIWDNTGTMSLNQTGYLGTPITNDDIVIFRKDFTNTCGDIIPNTFDIGPIPGSTLSVYTDAAATNSAGTYNMVTNVFTSNAHMPAGQNTFYVKIVDDAAICPDFIVPWIIDVTLGATEVTQTGDSGPGSLRCALIQANSYPGANTVTFNIPGASPHTIVLTGDLPGITDSETTIDAVSQPGWNIGDIILDGINYYNGIELKASDCSVLGIHFNNISGSGVFADNQFASGDEPTIEDCVFSNISNNAVLLLQTNNAVVENCLIGTDASGTADASGSASVGILAEGGSNFLMNNCTASGFDAVNAAAVFLKDTNGSTIENCYIGTDLTGTLPIPNFTGVHLDNCDDFLIRQNVISNSSTEAIIVE